MAVTRLTAWAPAIAMLIACDDGATAQIRDGGLWLDAAIEPDGSVGSVDSAALSDADLDAAGGEADAVQSVDVGVHALAPAAGEIAPIFLSAWGMPAEIGAGDDAVWFAGGEPGEFGGAIARLDGDRIVGEPIPPGRVLWWIGGVDLEHLWAVGEGGRVLARREGAWLQEASGLTEAATLWGVWAAAPNDVWAVGGSVTPVGPKAIILRSAGDGEWRRIEDDALPDDISFFKVWGSGPDDVHIVGDREFAMHWDGDGFERVDVARARSGGPPATLFTVHGRSEGPTLAVGGLVGPAAVRWSGSAWVDDSPRGDGTLNGVHVLDDGRAIAVGANGAIHWRASGGGWQMALDPPGGGFGERGIHAVWAGTDIWAVGGDLRRAERGLIATTRRPVPVWVSDPPDAGAVADALPSDALPSDAAASDAAASDSVVLDVSVPDVRVPDVSVPDASVADVSVPDAAILDTGVPDMGASDAHVPGPGEPCPQFVCDNGLICLEMRFVESGLFVCTRLCNTALQCGAFGVDPCCTIPGPQLLDRYCMPRDIYADGECPF